MSEWVLLCGLIVIVVVFTLVVVVFTMVWWASFLSSLESVCAETTGTTDRGFKTPPNN